MYIANFMIYLCSTAPVISNEASNVAYSIACDLNLYTTPRIMPIKIITPDALLCE